MFRTRTKTLAAANGWINSPLYLLLTICMLTCNPALALDPNSNEPIEIESDSVTFDDLKGFSEYSGNVIVSQGNTRLEADKITVIVENRQIVSIDASGKPAHFIDMTQKETHGYAQSIQYITQSAQLTLQGNAKLNQQDHFFSGDKILYDTRNKAVHATGNKTEGERVRIQFQPSRILPADRAPAKAGTSGSDNNTEQSIPTHENP